MILFVTLVSFPATHMVSLRSMAFPSSDSRRSSLEPRWKISPSRFFNALGGGWGFSLFSFPLLILAALPSYTFFFWDDLDALSSKISCFFPHSAGRAPHHIEWSFSSFREGCSSLF